MNKLSVEETAPQHLPSAPKTVIAKPKLGTVLMQDIVCICVRACCYYPRVTHLRSL